MLHQVYYPATIDLVFNFTDNFLSIGCPQFCILIDLSLAGNMELASGTNKLLKKYGMDGKLKR